PGMFKARGFEVRGSDEGVYPPMSDLLKSLGIEAYEGYSPENLSWNPDAVVIGNVIRRTNPEAAEVERLGIRYFSLPSALHEFFLKGRTPLVVAGTHGKTTTSSLLAWLLYYAGQDPSYLIGGIPLNFMSNHRLGEGKFFVLEGDEYDTAYFDKSPKFLHYAPQAAIVTNVEYDHADIFPDIERIISAFHSFLSLVPGEGFAVLPSGDKNVDKALAGARCKILRFEEEVFATSQRFVETGTEFDLSARGAPLGRFFLPLRGEHNLKNALQAIAFLLRLGIEPEKIHGGLKEFKGIKKRLEIKGIEKEVTVFDDFAHHPTAVRETIKAVRRHYAGRRIIALFEPESNTSRRRVFQDEYAKAFSEADCVMFLKPLEKKDNLSEEEKIDMLQLIDDIRKNSVEAHYIPDVDVLASQAASTARSGDIILAMSGRDFKGVHGKILEKLTASR
ncbi:MAG: hypothetical protein FJ088_13780, partial [Deltaproteobacteria bacterium]|nr:hypothetical protein [Deltaproteobacteria bacterium]